MTLVPPRSMFPMMLELELEKVTVSAEVGRRSRSQLSAVFHLSAPLPLLLSQTSVAARAVGGVKECSKAVPAAAADTAINPRNRLLWIDMGIPLPPSCHQSAAVARTTHATPSCGCGAVIHI